MWRLVSGVFSGGASLGLIGAGLIGVAALGSCTVQSLKESGAAHAELQRLEHIAQENASTAERLQKVLSKLAASEHQAMVRAQKNMAKAEKAVEKIDALPSTASKICPIDCLLPEVE